MGALPSASPWFWLEPWFLPLIAVLAAIVIPILVYRWERRDRRHERPFPLETVRADELYSRIGIPPSRIEPYFRRSQLVGLWGEDLLPDHPRLLFHGRQGVGKSREAVEVVLRITKSQRHHVLFAKGCPVAPHALPSHTPARDIVVLLDDVTILRGGSPSEADSSDGGSQRIEDLLQLFERGVERLIVILTMQTQQYRLLTESAPNWLERFQVVELHEALRDEKTAFVTRLAESVGLGLTEPHVARSLAEAANESLAELSDYLHSLADRGHALDTRAADELRGHLGQVWQKLVMPHLSHDERSVFHAISLLSRCSIDTYRSLVKVLYAGAEAGLLAQLWARVSFDRALTSLLTRWITEVDGRVLCHDSRLSGAREDTRTLRAQQLDEVTTAAIRLTKRNWWRPFRRNRLRTEQAVDLLNTLSRRWRILNQPDKARVCAMAALELDRLDPRTYLQLAASEALGKDGNLPAAERWLGKGLGLEPANPFLLLHLAGLRQRQGRLDESIDLFERVIATAPRDIAAHTVRLKRLTNLAPHNPRALLAYRDLRRLLRHSTSIKLAQRCSAETALFRFFVARRAGGVARSDKLIERASQRLMQIAGRLPRAASLAKGLALYEVAIVLADELERTDEAIALLDSALDALPSLTKARAKRTALTYGTMRAFDPSRELNRRGARTRLLGRGSTGWRLDTTKLEKSWQDAHRIVNRYRSLLRSAEGPHVDRFYNALIQHALGSFLWTVATSARKAGITLPPDLDQAEETLRKAADGMTRIETPELLSIDTVSFACVYRSLSLFLTQTSSEGSALHREALQWAQRALDLLSAASGAKGVRLASRLAAFEAYIALQLGRLEDAEALSAKAVQLFNRSGDVWWLYGRVLEQRGRIPDAVAAFEKGAELQRSPRLMGEVRGIRRDWTRKGVLEEDIESDLRLSRRAFQMDPMGRQNVKNLSDYGYDLFRFARRGAREAKRDLLEEAKAILLNAARRYDSLKHPEQAAFPLFFAGDCVLELEGMPSKEAIDLWMQSLTRHCGPDTPHQLAVRLRRLDGPRPLETMIELVDMHIRPLDFIVEIVELVDERDLIATTGVSRMPSAMIDHLEIIARRHSSAPAGKLLAMRLGLS